MRKERTGQKIFQGSDLGASWAPFGMVLGAILMFTILLIPIIEKAGMIEPNSINWNNYLRDLKEIDLEEDIYLKWDNNYNLKRFLLTKSIKEAANNDSKTLTVLLIARLIGDNPLIDFDLNSLITIRNSLNSIGLENLSKIITQEIMKSKIVNL